LKEEEKTTLNNVSFCFVVHITITIILSYLFTKLWLTMENGTS